MPRRTRRTDAPPPPLGDGYRANFATLHRAAVAGDLCLISARDRQTGEPRAVVAATYTDADGQIVIVPLATLFDGDPYRELSDPTHP